MTLLATGLPEAIVVTPAVVPRGSFDDGSECSRECWLAVDYATSSGDAVNPALLEQDNRKPGIGSNPF